MNTQEIVQKLWNLCNVLRDDGITYHEYVTELTYILFLKMAKETGAEAHIPETWRWDVLASKSGLELKNYYQQLLSDLGRNSQGRIREIYEGAQTKIDEPKNLEKIIRTIDELDWFSAREEGLGNLYEGLLEKNASEKKSGAGQYFTPRVLIDVMVRLMKPQPGEKCNDPCSGSGHILVYAFDVLMDIYQSQGYTEREAAQSILAHNLYGLDIDDRAYQLTYFALMMKARQYDRRIFTRGIRPQVYAVEESNGMEKWEGEIPQNQALDLSETYRDTADYLIDTFRDAKEYGSLIAVEPRDYAGLAAEIERLQQEGTDDLLLAGWLYTDGNRLIKLAKQAQVMSSQFWVLATNPPFMSASNMNSQLNKYVKRNFPDYKSDLFSACMVRCTHLTKKEGLMAFLSPYVWMFISSYENLRNLFINTKTIETLIQFEYSAFVEATVPICTFVIRNTYVNKKGVYFRLTKYRGGMEIQREKTLEAIENHDRKIYFEKNAKDFIQIPGYPIAYWVGKNMLHDFSTSKIMSDYVDVRKGMTTADNATFIRLWWEIEQQKSNIFNANKNNC